MGRPASLNPKQIEKVRELYTVHYVSLHAIAARFGLLYNTARAILYANRIAKKPNPNRGRPWTQEELKLLIAGKDIPTRSFRAAREKRKTYRAKPTP